MCRCGVHHTLPVLTPAIVYANLCTALQALPPPSPHHVPMDPTEAAPIPPGESLVALP